MTLTPGERLGPYEILGALGAGGMGEVYRATDTNLKRQVAIKVLPASVATDSDRLTRFQREAEVLAALNHPNIAHIFGLEKAGGTIALVIELVAAVTDLTAFVQVSTRGGSPLRWRPDSSRFCHAGSAEARRSMTHAPDRRNQWSSQDNSDGPRGCRGELRARPSSGSGQHQHGIAARGHVEPSSMTVQSMVLPRPSVPPVPEGPGEVTAWSPEQVRQVVETYDAYFGTYEVDQARHIVTHHVEGELRLDHVRAAYARRYEVDGDRLLLSSANPEERWRVVWERVK